MARTTAVPGSIDHEFNRRQYHLRRLGLMKPGASIDEAYDVYCSGRHWEQVRHDWRAGPGPHCCFVCGERRYQLHHATYARLGFEELEDLVPLCAQHHASVSTLINVYRKRPASAHRKERQAWELNWLGPKTPLNRAILERVDAARRREILSHTGTAVHVAPHTPADWQGPIRLFVGTDHAELLVIDATFPGGPGTDEFELIEGPSYGELSGDDQVIFEALQNPTLRTSGIGAAIGRRVDRARDTGRLSHGGRTIGVVAVTPFDWDEPVRFFVATDVGEVLMIDAAFPNGPSETDFELVEGPNRKHLPKEHEKFYSACLQAAARRMRGG